MEDGRRRRRVEGGTALGRALGGRVDHALHALDVEVIDPEEVFRLLNDEEAATQEPDHADELVDRPKGARLLVARSHEVADEYGGEQDRRDVRPRRPSDGQSEHESEKAVAEPRDDAAEPPDS